MKRLLYARLMIASGAVALAVAPFFPYTYVPISSWQIPLYGIFLSGMGLVIIGVLSLIQAVWGKGNLIFLWTELSLAGCLLWRDVRICTHDVGMSLGRAQLSLAGINNYLINLGFPPLHLIDAQQVHRPLEWGAYAAILGLILAWIGSLLWYAECGRAALWNRSERCSCGRTMEMRGKYCPYCGRSLREMPQRCRECGAPVREGWSYCAECGAPRR